MKYLAVVRALILSLLLLQLLFFWLLLPAGTGNVAFSWKIRKFLNNKVKNPLVANKQKMYTKSAIRN